MSKGSLRCVKGFCLMSCTTVENSSLHDYCISIILYVILHLILEKYLKIFKSMKSDYTQAQTNTHAHTHGCMYYFLTFLMTNV